MGKQHEALFAAKLVGSSSGGGGGTTDYSDLSHKPRINGVTLTGNKSTADLGLVSAESGKGLSTNDYTNADKAAVETIDDKYPKAWDVELTQAQYDALPASKYIDGKNYYITDGDTDEPIIYGFHIDPDESDSSDAVTYLRDAVGMEPAAMGTTAFNYGSWKNAFFMPKPCMLKYDGTVDYYLDPNDYTKKVDGTPSDIADYTYQGNVMIEFPKMYYKFESGTAEGEGYFYVSNQKIDDSYKCWCYLDSDGNETEHFYMAAYNGVTYDGKMRSLSGKKLSPWSTTAYSNSATYAVDSIVNYDDKMWKCTIAVEAAEAFDLTKWEQFGFNGNTTGAEEIAQATANNATAKVEWYTDVLCDRQLINALLVLLGKSLDTQSVFGRGIDAGGQIAKESYVTGSLNDKGLFYGSTVNGSTAVKVFGMENWWALVWCRTAGLIGGADNVYLYKMTASTADGSTVNGYSTDGVGYLSVGNKPSVNNYIKKMQYGLWGCLPIETGSYSTQYFRDYLYDGTGYALFGGHASFGAYDGAFFAYLNSGVGTRTWYISSDLSCKPLANKEV